jgi:hypothetical protein
VDISGLASRGEELHGGSSSVPARHGAATQGKVLVERNPSVDLLVAEAAKHKEEPGWVFTYPEMTRIAGGEKVLDIREKPSVLRSWLKLMLDEHDLVFVAVENIGYQLCDDPAKVDVMQWRVKKARRQLRTVLDVAAVTDANALDAHRKADFARASAAAHFALRDLGMKNKQVQTKAVDLPPDHPARRMLGLDK